eukprot:GHVU01074375.1.p1 GENE.GHVU01074375.1~~GHVU01074375.1.p1  ORF type:complete len:134 (+),score=8.00 GHVU01074375.1:278-679(+)
MSMTTLPRPDQVGGDSHPRGGYAPVHECAVRLYAYAWRCAYVCVCTILYQIILSGMLCFILKNNWFLGLSFLAKVPLSSLLGVSVTFAHAFSLVDLHNYVVGLFQPTAAQQLVESKTQVGMHACVCVCMCLCV